jgi:hypothetical protein
VDCRDSGEQRLPRRTYKQAVRPDRKVIVHIDIQALNRGEALPGERCYIEGVGDVPVSVVRSMLGAKTALAAGVKREWTGGEAARLNVPLTINENGDIGTVTYALPYEDLVARTSLTLRLDHEVTRQVALRAAVTRERYGFGTSVTGFAAMLEITERAR